MEAAYTYVQWTQIDLCTSHLFFIIMFQNLYFLNVLKPEWNFFVCVCIFPRARLFLFIMRAILLFPEHSGYFCLPHHLPTFPRGVVHSAPLPVPKWRGRGSHYSLACLIHPFHMTFESSGVRLLLKYLVFCISFCESWGKEKAYSLTYKKVRNALIENLKTIFIFFHIEKSECIAIIRRL